LIPSEEQLIHEDTEIVEEPDLGYYPDGTPRTLTDEQVAIFRHSEIEQLVKSYNAYLRDLEEEQEEEEAVSSESSAPSPAPLDFSAFADTIRQKYIFDQARKLARSAPTASGTQADHPKSHKEKKLEKRRTRNKRRKLAKEAREAFADQNDEEGRTHRRIAREQDERKEDDVALDY
jgi:hypothetical protein